MIANNEDDFDIRAKCIEKCKDMLDTIDKITEVNFKQVEGKKEIYYVSELNLNGHIMKIYVYNDGADYSVDGQDGPMFEMAAYNTEDDLINSFISKLESTVKSLL